MGERELLRVVFAGSVDDGKSTLIGRLLHDGGGVYEDQLRGAHTRDGLQLAFITDGLRVERERGITIDVAYRYFSTERRKFIIMDAPGHEEYTRNMVTGSSRAQLAVILVDAALAGQGPLPQTMRHARLAWLLGIRRIVFAINKMDLLDMRQEAFETIRRQCLQMAHALTGCQTDFLPLSALFGDNVVSASARLAWFRGPTLLEYLETIPIDPGPARAPFRYPIQAVIDGAYAGQIASGSVAPGDEVMLLPGRDRARVVSLPAYGGDLARAGAPMSIAIRLDGKHNIGRGDMLVDPNDPPQTAWTIRATLVWFGYGSLTSGRRFLLKHTTQQIRAEVKEIHSPGQLAAGLGPNDIGAVTIETERPLFCDTYEVNRRTGSFIMIDSESSQTLGVGLIRGATETTTQNRGCAIWLTGLSSAGKTTLSRALCQRLSARGLRVEMLDGDEIRRELWPDLGFSKRDRDENIHRLGFLAGMLARNGVVAIVAAISPYRAARQEARRQVASFVEVYVNAPLETCQQRDVKGLYRKVRDGEIRGVTGVDDPYEAPEAPEVECRTDRETVAESLEKIMQYIEPWMK